MNDETLKRWQELHKQVVCGEELSETDRAFYETELSEMHAEENYDSSLTELKQLRTAMTAAEKERAALKARFARNRKEIAALEAKLSERDKVLLGIGR